MFDKKSLIWLIIVLYFIRSNLDSVRAVLISGRTGFDFWQFGKKTTSAQAAFQKAAADRDLELFKGL